MAFRQLSKDFQTSGSAGPPRSLLLDCSTSVGGRIPGHGQKQPSIPQIGEHRLHWRKRCMVSSCNAGIPTASGCRSFLRSSRIAGPPVSVPATRVPTFLGGGKIGCADYQTMDEPLWYSSLGFPGFQNSNGNELCLRTRCETFSQSISRDDLSCFQIHGDDQILRNPGLVAFQQVIERVS